MDTLVAERWPRIGDSWRKRYHSLALWFIAGGLSQCRIKSKYLALQILATELGLLGPLKG
ncbi:hypothetical protein [Pseudooceanicola sp.]|uniref:hypothetical protein n=1 Tax=Pseudooceanicola sp. TaxID=1914328 RepID=UPI002628020A|nr:hypothetical protein [Pseudooceanicola sp.]MDF1855891.1 hypothetical protein [Pseudooceanicola sp.]